MNKILSVYYFFLYLLFIITFQYFKYKTDKNFKDRDISILRKCNILLLLIDDTIFFVPNRYKFRMIAKNQIENLK